MDAEEFVDGVEAATETELGRLGSQKLLVALTGADLDATTVLRAAAASEHAARETFEAWAADEADDAARAAFAEVAAQEAEHFERVVAELDGFEPPEEIDPMQAHLRGLDDTVARVAAGLVGRGLVGDRTHAQVVSFFINEADPSRTDLFRDLREETRAWVDRGADLLDAVCETDGDWNRAREAATAVVEVAYEEYAESLEGMGVDPKPIC